jgi:hypothetical protein
VVGWKRGQASRRSGGLPGETAAGCRSIAPMEGLKWQELGRELWLRKKRLVIILLRFATLAELS